MRSRGKHVECRTATPKGSRFRGDANNEAERMKEIETSENDAESGKCKEFRRKVMCTITEAENETLHARRD
jgi:hypothetical protein